MKQINQMTSAIAAGLVSEIYVVCMDDAESRRQVTTEYRSSEWANDIAAGWEIFKRNIVANLSTNDCTRESSQRKLTPGACFPCRQLSQSEHSVALRHIYALETIAKAKSPCLVLEDDAIVRDEELLHELLLNLRQHCKPRVYYDLCDDYISIDKIESKSIFSGSFEYSMKVTAVTRTLLAYAMAPSTASLLLNSLTHYSLPIDMQFQVSLSRLQLPGLCLINSPFVHGSKTGALPSSIHQSGGQIKSTTAP
jgi:GR25 family glycosyltransferase involved in LPS biosynthesis